MGGRADDARGQGLAASRPDGARRPSPARSPGPIVYPWPQRPAGLIETAFDGARQALEADPRRVRRSRRRRLLRDPSRRGPARRRDLREVSRRASAATSAATSTTTRRISCCSSSTTSTSSTSITSASRRFTSRTPSSIRPAARASIRATRRWVERAGRFRSLGDGQVDFSGIFSKMAQYGYSTWAVLEWECCLKHPEDGAREGARIHQAATSSASPTRRSTISPAARSTRRRSSARSD